MSTPWSAIVIHLLRGPLMSDSKHWPALLNYEQAIRDYVAVIGLELLLDPVGAYACLKQDPESELPRLMRTRPYSYLETAAVVVLRRLLLASEDQGHLRTILDPAEFVAQMQRFASSQSTDQAGYQDQVIKTLRRLEEKAGFVRLLPNGEIEVLPLIKAVFDLDTLKRLAHELGLD